jgi:hypothetical protein
MKALKYIIAGVALILAGAGQAQVDVTVNIGVPPLWGPAGYAEVRYYYLPDVESYYDVHASMFICYVEDAWVHRTNLPSRYKNYDLYGGYKVVITDYYGTAPYKYFDDHKAKYAKGYKGPYQKTIGEKPGNDNPGSKNSQGGNNGNGNSKGQGGGNGNKK